MNLFKLNKQKESREANRENLLKSIREEITQSWSIPLPEDSEPVFVTAYALGEILTRPKIREILTGFNWHVEVHIETIWKHLRQVLATLIMIGWDGWSDFKAIFLDKRDLFGRPVRGDHLLPFSDLSFLSGVYSRHAFKEKQHMFRPIVIVENSHKIYSDKSLLPFLESEKIRDGAFGAVTRVLVEKHQIAYTSGSLQGEHNSLPRNMARKVINVDREGIRSFHTEKLTLEQFKTGLMRCENIMMSFATFVHGSQFNIISPLASLDLHTFLHGAYEDFRQRSTDFTPHFLFKEVWCLAVALKFLHEGLVLSSGPVSCAHLDLKPENILVIWSPQRVSTAQGSSHADDDKPVGMWKISDFGISVVRPLATRQHLTPGDVIREQSLRPPRDSGPFQPPEMQRHKGLKVTTSSDMWSFGCIIAMVLAFALKGPEKVGELYSCRHEEYSDDYFYTDGPDGPEVKPEIEKWLRAQTELDNYKKHWSWVRECVDLVQCLLTIDKHQRQVASQDAGNRLLKIGKITRDLPMEDQKVWVSNVVQPQQEPVEPNVQEINDRPTLEFPSPQSGSSAPFQWPPISNAGSFQLLNTPEPSAFARLEPPPNATQATLSAGGERVAFLNRNSVYVYELDEFHRSENRWTSQRLARRVDKESMQQSFQCFHRRENRQWTSVLLAGPFIGLASTSRNSYDYTATIDLHNRPELGDLQLGYVHPIHNITVPEGCLEVKLSPQGVLLLQFHHRLELSSESGHSSIDLEGRLQAASFSNDGKWLFAWHSDNAKHFWFIWGMDAKKMRAHGTYPRNSHDGQSGALREVLVPATHFPRFTACDQYGHISMIRGDLDPLRQPWNHQLHAIVAGLTPTSDDAVVLIRQPHSVTSNQTIEVVLLSHGNFRPDVGIKSFGELDNAIDPNKCGAAICSTGPAIYILTCYPDGLIARKQLAQRRSNHF